MSKFTFQRDYAQVRVVVADQTKVEAYNDHVRQLNIAIEKRDGSDGEFLNALPRMVMLVEVSSDGGKTWAMMLTKGGMSVETSKQDGNTAHINIPLHGFDGEPEYGLLVHAELPQLPVFPVPAS